MPLEVGTYISDLVASNPTGSDNKSTGDDHMRLIKSTLKASFPAVSGPVTKSHAELNAAHDQRVPVGGIIMWSGAFAAIPAGWLLCNGLNGTPNLADRFVVGAGAIYAVGAAGGSRDATLPAHTHAASLSGSTNGVGDHTHGVNDPGHTHAVASGGANTGNGAFADANVRNNASTLASFTGISLSGAGAHSHSVSVSGTTDSTGGSATNANLPPYYALAFIMKSA